MALFCSATDGFFGTVRVAAGVDVATAVDRDVRVVVVVPVGFVLVVVVVAVDLPAVRVDVVPETRVDALDGPAVVLVVPTVVLFVLKK